MAHLLVEVVTQVRQMAQLLDQEVRQVRCLTCWVKVSHRSDRWTHLSGEGITQVSQMTYSPHILEDCPISCYGNSVVRTNEVAYRI